MIRDEIKIGSEVGEVFDKKLIALPIRNSKKVSDNIPG
ncbi:hypothetical protein CLOBL_34220 [Clostridium sp. BL-8]|nr:hypothetical protein CLOBL_34220 [Clostridium sp. BL-8]